jgi:hypothetical protein
MNLATFVFFSAYNLYYFSIKLKHMKLKLLTLLALITLVFNQCKKEPIDTIADAKAVFTQKAKQYLTAQIPPDDFNKLDWSKAIVYEKAGQYSRIKIPLTGNQSATDKAVYLKYDKEVFTGNYFSINKPGASSETITTLSLNNVYKCVVQLTQAQTVESYQKYEHGRLVYDSQSGVSPNTSIRLIRAYIADAPGVYYHVWVNILGTGQPGSGDPLTLQQLDNMGTLDYLSPDPSISNPSGGIGEILELEYDDWESKPSVDIRKLFKCFDDVYDFPGTTYEIALNADLPTNSHPQSAIDFLGSPGHTFISITKSNSTYNQSVTQNFGFYPTVGLASFSLDNVPGKIVNDEFHETNAQIKIQISQNDFNLIRANAIYWATLPYNLQTNNCSDFALNLFNLTRINNPIVLPVFLVRIILPFGINPITVPILNAPQTLFSYLNQQKVANTADAPYINIDQTHSSKAPLSKGECN